MLAYLTPVGEFVHSADAKAATILTLLGIMFTLLARFGGVLDEMIRAGGALTVVSLPLLAGFAFCALGTVVEAFRTISPRFPEAPPSLAFFGDIARLSREQYLARVESLSPADALAEKLSYNHTGSRIIMIKMRELRRCLRLFEVAALCWVALAALILARILAAKVVAG
jgi:hypothetical protein